MAQYGNRQAILDTVLQIETMFSTPQPSRLENSPLPPRGDPTPPPGISAEAYHQGLHRGPPPGLVRVCPPSLTPTRVLCNENVSLFGDFARYLDNMADEDGRPVVVDLTCLICMEHKLSVSCHPSADYPSFDPAGFEWMTVLPCGHFFGSDCLEDWLTVSASTTTTTTAAAIAAAAATPITAASVAAAAAAGEVEEGEEVEEEGVEVGVGACPVCRFEMAYSCGHRIPTHPYNPVAPRAGQVPATLPEGGEIPNACHGCYERRVANAADRLRHLLFPRDIVPADLRWADSAEVLQRTSMRFRERVLDFLVMNEHFIAW